MSDEWPAEHILTTIPNSASFGNTSTPILDYGDEALHG